MATAETLAVAEDTATNVLQVELLARDVAIVGVSTLLATLFSVLCFRSN